MSVCILESGTVGPRNLFRQPAGFPVALHAQGAFAGPCLDDLQAAFPELAVKPCRYGNSF